jgi:O-antigen/teichoic acid export membrane protein
LSAHALPGRLHGVRAALRGRPTGAVIARTACFNVAAAGAAALGGVIMARAVGPTVRGEYAAVTSWLGVLLLVGEVGQTAAVCFYVARDPRRARSYVATSRTMLLLTGGAALACGLVAAPALAHGNPGLVGAYRLTFAGSLIGFVGASYTFSLQARSIRRWNLVRLSQPVLGLAGIAALWRLRMLTLDTAVVTLIVTTAIQLGYACYWCRRTGLARGRFHRELVRPLARYGVTQLVAVTPTAVNMYLDQLVLSQVVPAADLGRYAIAVSITLLPVPLVSAIGNVAFPHLAAQRVLSARSSRLQRSALLASAGVASAILFPVAAIAHWLVPLVFGPNYSGVIPLLWLLTPGGVFLACGQVAGDLLRGLGRPGLVAAAQGLAAVFTVILLIALLPVAGVAAAAIASTVAYGVALAVMTRVLWLQQPVREPSRGAGEPEQGSLGEGAAPDTECQQGLRGTSSCE